MDSRVRAAIGRIVDYNWNDEERDYAECSDEPGCNARTGHIFEDLQLVAAWLNGAKVPAGAENFITVKVAGADALARLRIALRGVPGAAEMALGGMTVSTQKTPVGVAPDGFAWTGPDVSVVCCTRCGSRVNRWLTDEHNTSLHAPQSRGGIPVPPGPATWTTGDPRVGEDLRASLAALDAVQDALSANLDPVGKLGRVEAVMREAGRKIPYDPDEE